ncbi:MAG: hypothetical protein A2W98_05765 [Bacteroidetes bacterium GWF2_33_38]|nr:MAG: hypothetical protein A2W98_05765 [Bacteroidetes bacterium GWF2_33_38]OFY71682.1 MAG: hypothetical protein A2265_01170 [Bacteroidetes bacterium RIFOXYA12_FULL_33_9]OFY88518.1 MAG: hypothetical protein A2236_10275 [Bacteroidetes bacterium RIFOXYA2_FULL_33_7]HBX51668.1 DUF1573 domain-containing protein [Bacteroidales bacterium]
MKKRIFFVAFAFMIMNIQTVFSQQKTANISFFETTHDFGSIKEADGNVTCVFEFNNTGNQPLILSNVKASCGCTTPEWTKEPIAPGAKGSIKATYNPARRPGQFNKSITVTSNSENPTTVLFIKGDVIPVSTTPTTPEDEFKQALGELKLKSTHIAFNQMFNSDIKTEEVDVFNPTDKPLKITFENFPPHFSLKAIPEVLAAGAKGKIVATYDATKKNDWGYVVDRVRIFLNDDKTSNYRIAVSARIEEKFDEASKAVAPKAVFDSKDFTFGTIKQGESASHDFVLKNEGKSNLIIRKTKASCGCTAIAPENNVIAPGESTKIKTTFNSAGKKGVQNKTITVITNDPENTTIILNVKGEVTVPEGQQPSPAQVH